MRRAWTGRSSERRRSRPARDDPGGAREHEGHDRPPRPRRGRSQTMSSIGYFGKPRRTAVERRRTASATSARTAAMGGVVAAAAQRPRDQRGDRRELVLRPCRRRLRGGAEAQPRRHEGAARVVGDLVAVERDAGAVEDLLGLLAGELGVEVPQVDEQQVVVGAARHEPEPLARRAPRRAPRRCATTGARTARSSGSTASRNATAFAAITCSSGPPCSPGKTAESIALACSARHTIAPPRGPAQRLVGREGDDVGVRRRGSGATPPAIEPGDVGHVEHQQRARPRRRSLGTPRPR